MNAKKSVLLFVLLLVCTNVLFSTSNGIGTLTLIKEKELIITDIKNEYEKVVMDSSYKELVHNVVPEPFTNYFYEETKNYNIEFNLILLSIAQYESGWKIFIHKKNKDGSVDYGPMGLNSKNILNSRFVEQFFPKDIKFINHNKDIVYMIACIRYFKSLYDKYNKENAIMIYNAGYTRVKRGDIPNITKRYLNIVREYYNIYYNMYITIYNKIYVEKNKEFIKSKVQALYIDDSYIKVNKNITYIGIYYYMTIKSLYTLYAKEKKFYIEFCYTKIPTWFDVIVFNNNYDDMINKHIIYIYRHIG